MKGEGALVPGVERIMKYCFYYVIKLSYSNNISNNNNGGV